MINIKIKSGLLFFSPTIKPTYIYNNNFNKKLNIIRYSPKKNFLSYGMIGILGAFSHFALADNASNSSLESSSEQNASAANNGNALAEHLSSNKAVTPNPLLIDETSSLSTSDANSVDEKPLNKRADKRRRKKNKLLLDRSRRLEINSLKTLTPTTPPLITAAAAGGSTGQPASATTSLTGATAGGLTGQPALASAPLTPAAAGGSTGQPALASAPLTPAAAGGSTAQPASATAPLTTAAAGSSTGQPASNPTDAFERGPGELNAREPALALNVSNHNDGATATPATLAQHRNRVEALAPVDASSINSMFSQDPETDVISVGQNVEGNTLSVSGAHGDRIITGVAEGVSNNDVANIAQLKQVRSTATSAQALAQKNTSRIKEIENKLAKTNTKIDRGLASSAALTGLFQPYGVGKVNLTAGLGGYGSSQAIAIGSGYRINENTAFKAGVAYSDGNSVMYNASFNLEW